MDGKIKPQVVPERRPTEYVLHGFLPATREVGGQDGQDASAGLALPGLRLSLRPRAAARGLPGLQGEEGPVRAVFWSL